ncbi:hypothetical protein GCM10011495_36010 [Hymenobacter frigidus]|uniref:FAD-dependent oxidoreductase n=1 Tax=Hymenobacter frigidus TaxID=1524095 RepID=A0ABQ2AGY6_9BACT|nr:NAD(P)/FAD-dependent oxidoreductase [Hymenobacter frigidus]GGH90348.1 hypothetical protein GCM10011495_36010 [Hymenobacter frigidus]
MVYHSLILGAGQAGLAAAYYLRQAGVSFLVLEASEAVGNSWVHRYDSLRLFSPASYDALPGLAFPLPPESYPAKDEVAAYLRQYVAHHQLPVRCNEAVRELTLGADGVFTVQTAHGELRAHRVVVATGSSFSPLIPPVAAQLAESVFQVHSRHYHNPAQLPPGPVLVVGAGNSGAQIAAELACSRPVVLSEKAKPRFWPITLLGKSTVWWTDQLGLLHASTDSWAGPAPVPSGPRVPGGAGRARPAAGESGGLAEPGHEGTGRQLWAAWRGLRAGVVGPGAAGGRRGHVRA